LQTEPNQIHCESNPSFFQEPNRNRTRTEIKKFIPHIPNDRTSERQGVDAARRYLFSKKSMEIENIPPTAATLLEHMKRAAFQAGHI